MNTDNHHLISSLSEKYADRMCEGGKDTFSRGSITAAYIIGAEATLHRVCNVILESGRCGGISPRQSGALINLIQQIEATPQ